MFLRFWSDRTRYRKNILQWAHALFMSSYFASAYSALPTPVTWHNDNGPPLPSLKAFLLFEQQVKLACSYLLKVKSLLESGGWNYEMRRQKMWYPPVFRIRIWTGSGFNQVSGSGSGSRRAKMTHKNRKKVKKFQCLKYGMFSFEGWRLLL
jgi:hypothetical protein